MSGWRLLGDAWVTGQFDRQIIRVGKYEGRVARVMLVITHSNLEVGDSTGPCRRAAACTRKSGASRSVEELKGRS